MLALVAALLACQDWQYQQDIGFVDRATMERKTPAEFVDHGVALREAGRHDEAVRVLTLALDHVTEATLREKAHFERAAAYAGAGRPYDAYQEFESFVLKFPQSARATEAKRREMAAALALARTGNSEYIVFSTSRTGVDFLREALRRYPREDFSAYYYQELGMFFYQKGDLAAAEVEFTTVLEQYPDSPVYVVALYMMGRSRENQFDDVPYDMKPIRDARRHYESFLEQAERLRKLPAPAAQWVDEYIESVRQRRARLHGLMVEKERRTARYYDWKGYPKSAAISYRAILTHSSCCRQFNFSSQDLPMTKGAEEARAWLVENGEPLPPPPKPRTEK